MTVREMIKSWKGRVKASGLTQEQFAKKIGVSKVSVSRWFSGVDTPTVDNIDKVEALLATYE